MNKAEYLKEWRTKNPEYKAPGADKSKLKYRESIKGKAKEKAYQLAYKDRQKELAAKRRLNPEYIAKEKAWHKKHAQKPEIVARRRELHNKWSKNPQYTIKRSLRAQITNALRLYSTKGKTLSSRKYGLDYLTCIQYLEKQAEEMGYTMNELRQMKFHIDHKIPVSLYDLNDKDDIKHCFNPINLQWLSQVENIVKGNQIVISLIKTLPKEIYPKSWKGIIPKE